MNLKLKEIAKAVGSKDIYEGEITSICRDTRDVVEGSLFICLEGDRFDGHTFAKKAQECGAAAILAHKPVDADIPVILCNNTRRGILDLAAYIRNKMDIPVVALTGSVGKTTTKEMIALVMSQKYKTISTIGNLNNEIGLPLTIFRMQEDTEAAVLEMGMSHFGEISAMSKCAQPTMAVITNIGVSHMENLGSRQGILQAKTEILHGMKKGSTIILNGDDEYLRKADTRGYNAVFYAIENPDADFIARHIIPMPIGTQFDIVHNGREYNVYLPAIGLHNIYNALAAFTMGFLNGVEPAMMVNALKEYKPSGMRQNVVSAGEITVIEDCYNASPDSIKAALSALSALQCHGKRIAVLGDMLELGAISEQEHKKCGILAAQSADVVLCCGEMAIYYYKSASESGYDNILHFNSKPELLSCLLEMIEAGDSVLFKASRGMKFEELLEGVYAVHKKQA